MLTDAVLARAELGGCVAGFGAVPHKTVRATIFAALGTANLRDDEDISGDVWLAESAGSGTLDDVDLTEA